VREEYEEVRERHKGREAKTKQHPIEEARRNKFNWGNYEPVKPSFLGIKVIERFPLDTLVWYIDWSPFFPNLGNGRQLSKILDDKVVGVEARKLFDDAQVMLKKIISEQWLTARAVVGFFRQIATVMMLSFIQMIRAANDWKPCTICVSKMLKPQAGPITAYLISLRRLIVVSRLYRCLCSHHRHRYRRKIAAI